MAELKQRNNTVDILRGIAMLLVVLGHTMTGSTVNSEASYLFNIVWTLQMPLFMLISGYVNKYSKPISSISLLGKVFVKKTVAYLLPWAVWTFLIRGIVFKQTGYLDIKSLMFNMDSGYWFLFSVWTIAIILGIASFIGENFFKKYNEYARLGITTFFYICGMVVLAGIGYFMGLSFLCIKLTLYYMPFYYVGYLYGKSDVKLSELKGFKPVKEAIIAICFVAWIFLMNRYNFYEIGDGGFGIILRAGASMFGCVAICGLVAAVVAKSQDTARKFAGGGYSSVSFGREVLAGDLPDTLSCVVDDKAGKSTAISNIDGSSFNGCKLCVDSDGCCLDYFIDKSQQATCKVPFWQKALTFCGTHSLEIYVMHGFFLNILTLSSTPEFDTLKGIAVMVLNYMLAVGLTCFVAFLLNSNKIFRKYIFGKNK